jgi:hypothetical protein
VNPLGGAGLPQKAAGPRKTLQKRKHVRDGALQHKDDRKKFIFEGESSARTCGGDQPDYGQLAFLWFHIYTRRFRGRSQMGRAFPTRGLNTACPWPFPSTPCFFFSIAGTLAWARPLCARSFVVAAAGSGRLFVQFVLMGRLPDRRRLLRML